jgi:hypothetical protein
VQGLAAELDAERFGVRAAYVCEALEDAIAGPEGGLELIIHLERAHRGRRELEAWLEGWSLCLAEVEHLRTGSRPTRPLHIRLVTDDHRLQLKEGSRTRVLGGSAQLPAAEHRPSQHVLDCGRPGLYDG